MKAEWNGQTVAEAPQSDLIRIDGNWYFPPSSTLQEFYKKSDVRTTCVWKGQADYYDLIVNGEKNEGAAWYYHEPKAGSTERVKADFTDYVAFWRGVEVHE